MLDVITIGRGSVDLYGAQVGGRLEDMGSFNKYIGGSPTNIAAGCARLGLKSGLITRVGDEHMGRFIREQLIREGVNVEGVVTDPERLSALVLLGIRDQTQFPLIFYRENCADMALCEDDIDEEFVRSARCICATGTHLSHLATKAAVLKALDIARQNGARTALDIDFRPNLWGLSGHGDGENRFIASADVTARLQSTLHLFDLIVGTEEEFQIAGGSTDTMAALRRVRELSSATLVCKRGPMGASAFEGAIGDELDKGLSGPGFNIEVFNVLGAGDGFMSGLLKGWLGGEDWPTSLKYANACGALAVSRHGCTPAYPSWDELQYFLDTGINNPALRHDRDLEQVHWATNRPQDWPTLRVFSIDQQSLQFSVDAGRIATFHQLCLSSLCQVANNQPGYGLLCDGQLGRDALYKAADHDIWIGRTVNLPEQNRQSSDIGLDFGGLSEWPRNHVVNVNYSPDIPLNELLRLFTAARRNQLELALTVDVSGEQLAEIIQQSYDKRIFPDWWKFAPMCSDDWARIGAVIQKNDHWCRGILLAGQGGSFDQLTADFEVATRHHLVKGFAVGPAIYADVATAWFCGDMSDDMAIAEMATKYRHLCELWNKMRGQSGEAR